MASRIELQLLLESLLGTRNVYFQPPETVKMSYPAIVYSLNNINNRFANDDIYSQKRSYSVTLIDKNPDNETVGKLSILPYCRFDRFFVNDNINHYVFTIYY